MLILASNSDQLRLITGSAGAVDVHASWMDNVSGSVAPGRTNTANITAAANTVIVPAPSAGVQRNIKTVHIRNRGTTNNQVSVQLTDGVTPVILYSRNLAPGDTLQYVDEVGFILPDRSQRAGSTFLIESKEITTPVASLEFTRGIDASCDEYEIHFFNVAPSVQAYLGMRVSQDHGATWQTDLGYFSAGYIAAFNTASSGPWGMGLQSAGFIGGITNPTPPLFPSGVMKIFTPWESTVAKSYIFSGYTAHPTVGGVYLDGFGIYAPGGAATTQPHNALQVLWVTIASAGIAGSPSAANFTRGTVNLYGIQK
jgi:hypothetical protein